jgi:AraC-like DNA-binding protein
MLLSISENILLFISGFGMLQGVLLALLLYFHPRSDRSVTSFLGFYIFFVSVPLLIPVGQQLFSWQVIIFVEPFTVLIGPFLYLYVRSFKETITWRKAWPHLVIFIPFAVIALVLYEQVGKRYPASTLVPKEVTEHLLSRIPVSVRLLQRLLYFFLAYKALTTYQRSIRHVFSETSRISLRWVRWLINGYLFVTLATITLYILILNYPAQFSLWVLSIGTLVTVYLYIAAFKGLTQPSTWQAAPGIEKEKLEAQLQEAGKRPQPKKLPEPDERTGSIVRSVMQLLTHEKIFQEPELTLQHLANRLQQPAYLVSQAINEGMGKTFYELINGYRVEEAKQLLVKPGNTNYTILSIGFEAGFNSKTTFNTVFKKFTGLTPTEYREKHCHSEVSVA